MKLTLRLLTRDAPGYWTIFWLTAQRYPRELNEGGGLLNDRFITFALRVRTRYCENRKPRGMLLPFVVWSTRLNSRYKFWPEWKPIPEPEEVS